MSAEGLRAWIAEVERKLGKRTRVFLVLTVIAIGIAGASLYLAIDARNNSVSESDVQKLQQELETRIDEGGGTATLPSVPPTETAPTPEATPAPPSGGQSSKPKNGTGSSGGSGSGTGGGSSSGTGGGGGNSGGGSGGGGAANSGGATGGAGGSAKLEELLEQAQKKNAEAEADQKAK